jgi:CO/xanthine dehydrogenase FAD-binding subunit
VALDELWTAPGKTSAAPDELLVALELPAPTPGTGSCYVRLEYRRQMEIAVVGATGVLTVDGDRVGDARIAITALTPTIRRVPEAEAALDGTDGGADAIAAAAAAAAAASTPISDVRASADYRRAMAEVMAARAITAALARARGDDVPIPASPALHGAP